MNNSIHFNRVTVPYMPQIKTQNSLVLPGLGFYSNWIKSEVLFTRDVSLLILCFWNSSMQLHVVIVCLFALPYSVPFWDCRIHGGWTFPLWGYHNYSSASIMLVHGLWWTYADTSVGVYLEVEFPGHREFSNGKIFRWKNYICLKKKSNDS